MQGARLETIIMPTNFKKLVKERRAKTGESHQTAQRHVRAEQAAKLGENAESPAAAVLSPSSGAPAPFAYVHVEYGGPHGTAWFLSDDPKGAVLRIPVPEGPLTSQAAEEAFERAAFPLVIETSSDGGKTWVQHPDETSQPDWRSAKRRLYGLLGVGGGHWNAGRIRARSGEDLVRDPPQLLQDIADRIRAEIPEARIMLRAPTQRIIVSFGNRHFEVATMQHSPTEWPIYVMAPRGEMNAHWECFVVDDVLSALRYPTVQPKMRLVSADEIKAKSANRAQAHARPPVVREFVAVPAPSPIRVIPKFDTNDPRFKTTRLDTGAYRDPVRPVQILNEDRDVIVWIIPLPEGSAGWRFEVMHQAGPWPLRADERAALEDWLEHFAQNEWPDRVQLWPLLYKARV